MAAWVADNGVQVRVFDTEKQAREWLAMFSASVQKVSGVWNMMAKEAKT